MYDNILHTGCSLKFLQDKLVKVKGLLSKVKVMSKPSNFTYMDCADLCVLLETEKSALESAIAEAKKYEK